jgi:hypothetical protein
MLDPGLLGSTPFKSPTAYIDLIGTVSLMHAILIEATIRTTGNTPARFGFDAFEPQDDMLEAIQAQHKSLAEALGLGAAPDLQSFRLTDPAQWASWTFILAADLTRLRDAAGVL